VLKLSVYKAIKINRFKYIYFSVATNERTTLYYVIWTRIALGIYKNNIQQLNKYDGIFYFGPRANKSSM